jgi:hypothetical protein
MRVAVFSTPRTCSSLMCYITSRRFEIHNHREDVYTHFTQGMQEEKLEFLKTTDGYVVKLFSRYFHNDRNIRLNDMNWNMFDYVFITERVNLVDQMASLYRRIYENTTYINLQSSEVLEFYLQHKEYLKLFYNIKTDILSLHKNAYVVTYEGLQNNPIKYLNSVTNLNFIDSNIPLPKVFPAVTQTLIDYKQYFTNYNELKLFVESWNLIKD